MILIPQFISKWGFNTGLKAGQITGGVVTDEVTAGFQQFTDFSSRLKNNILVAGIFIIIILLLGLKLFNRITR